MNNKTLVFLASILLILNLSLLSAYTSPWTSSYSSSFQHRDPSFMYGPTIYNNMQNNMDKSSAFNQNYRGPLYDRTTSYDEYLDIRASGRVIRTISSRTSEKFAGESNLINSGSQDRSSSSSSSGSSTPQPLSYIGSSDWGSSDSYYYAPRQTNYGYYNWRY